MTTNESAILNALQGPAVILDANGKVTNKNTSWNTSKNSLSFCEHEFQCDNFFEHIAQAIEEGNDYALRLLFGIKEVLNGMDFFTLTITKSIKGQKKWYKVEASPIQYQSEKHVLMVFNDITENLKNIHQLRESEALYRQNFKYSAAGIIFGKETGGILDVNQAACNMLGYTKWELIEGGRSMIVDEDDSAHREVVRIRNEKSIFQGEKEYKHKDGRYIPVQLTSIRYKTDDNEHLIINTFQDLQSEKEKQHTLEEERRFTKTALNSTPGIFFVINSDKKFVRWNDSMLTDLGYKDEEIVEKSVFDIFDSSEEKNIHSFINDAFKNGKTEFVGKINSKPSGTRHYNLQFNTFQSNDERYLVVTGVDTTDFIESEKLREQNYQLMSELFNNSSIATVMINPENEAQKVNKAFIDLFGYSSEEVIGRNVNTLITSSELEAEAKEISKLAFEGESDQRTTVRLKKDGSEVPVLISTVSVRNNGNIIAVYGMYVDLTEQVSLKNHLQKSLTEKEILLQEVHHRVKNNLAIIASLLQLQILNDCNEYAKPKLQEAYSRIFSIAKVHESLYNQDNISEISFTDYLSSVVDTMPNVARDPDFDMNIQKEETPLILNVNQAVPLSLLINELVNLTPGVEGKQQAELSYKCEGDQITISVSGLDNQIEEFNSDANKSDFHHLLIKTFLQQIDAVIDVEQNCRNKFVISFKKKNSFKGSSNTLTNQETNLFKKSVA